MLLASAFALDPKTGAADFRYPFRSRIYESVTGSSPVVGDGWVFVTAAYGLGSTVLALDADGGHEEVWQSRRVGLEFSNAVFEGGHLYAVDGRYDRAGAVICLDPKTGAELSRTDFDLVGVCRHERRDPLDLAQHRRRRAAARRWRLPVPRRLGSPAVARGNAAGRRDDGARVVVRRQPIMDAAGHLPRPALRVPEQPRALRRQRPAPAVLRPARAAVESDTRCRYTVPMRRLVILTSLGLAFAPVAPGDTACASQAPRAGGPR